MLHVVPHWRGVWIGGNVRRGYVVGGTRGEGVGFGITISCG